MKIKRVKAGVVRKVQVTHLTTNQVILRELPEETCLERG